MPNFAAAIDIHWQSLASAIVFTVLYVALLGFFSLKCFTHPSYVHYVLTFFCIIRVAAFTIRAIFAGSEAAGETLELYLAYVILSSVGYFSLLYSSYTLVLDRTLLSDLRAANHPILKFTQDRRIFGLLLLVGVVLGIVGDSITTTFTNRAQIQALRISGVAIFLFLTVVQALQTAILATSSTSGQSQYYIRGKDSLGIRYGNYILLIISLLLIIREIFSITITTNANGAALDNEHLWYPLISLPEILVVILCVTPGLVPTRDELLQYSAARQEKTTDATEIPGWRQYSGRD